MKIIITAREALDRGIWVDLCEVIGKDPHMLESIQYSEEIELTEEQAIKLRIIKTINDGDLK